MWTEDDKPWVLTVLPCDTLPLECNYVGTQYTYGHSPFTEYMREKLRNSFDEASKKWLLLQKEKPMDVFEYVVFWPGDVENGNGAKIITQSTKPFVSKNQRFLERELIANLPPEYKSKIDRVEIRIRPFCR